MTILVTPEKEPENWTMLFFHFVSSYRLNNSSLINCHTSLNMIARMSGLRNSLLMTQRDSHIVISNVQVPVIHLNATARQWLCMGD